MDKSIKKILLLGSGALKIGEAGEFDYSGSQAAKAISEEKIKVVLVNPNIATVQTDKRFVDRVYFLPVNFYFVKKVIEKERPQALLLSFGGQTALNCGLELARRGVFKKYHLKVLGTSTKTIEDTEDRDLFIKRLNEIDVKTAKSRAVSSLVEAKKAAKKIGYPLMLRVAFALGGQGSGIILNEGELCDRVQKALTFSPQVLIEECLWGWKEIEYEVVRDCQDNCVTVCNMENFDPVGIHTGESIVVAPSQTLNNFEYHFLREISQKVVRHLKIIGECNIQFALNPKNGDYRVIEVNARLSRSSALASKATGYPLAYVAAKLALGYTLPEIKNAITKVTQSCFEPALDYLVVKIPRWDLKKFKEVKREIGSEMKSVGEVMAIGRNFEEALQKALRMLDIGAMGLVGNEIQFNNEIEKELAHPTDLRIFAVAQAIKQKMPLSKISKLSGVDRWFLSKIKNILEIEKAISKTKDQFNEGTSFENFAYALRQAKQAGFSDLQIAKILGVEELKVRHFRKKLGILPLVKQIDTLAAEFPAKTNYLYLTYHGQEDDVKPESCGAFHKKKSIIILGSGVYRIGSSVEFDWCAVNCAKTAQRMGYKTIMVNYNPETVSTDYDMCSRLYFEELTLERIFDIYEFEKPQGLILSMGGQIPNNLAIKLSKLKVKILGTKAEDIDRAEDRHKFSSLLDKLKIDQPPWRELTSHNEAGKFACETGFPVLVRPSYVLSGQAMNIALDEESLKECLLSAAKISKEHPVVISKFIEEAKEIEIDGVAKAGKLIIYAISEHVENAGVHSGDATLVLPPQRVYLETIRRIKEITKKIVGVLNITGPFNIQFLAKDNEIKVIECNLRASRSFPFVSKVTKYNFIDLATRAMFGKDIKGDYRTLDLDYVGVKAPQFSYARLRGADPVLYVEMGSTGEVACFGKDLQEAFLKAYLACGGRLPKKSILLSIGGEKNKIKLKEMAKKLEALGFDLFATEHTHQFLAQNGVASNFVYKIREESSPNISELLAGRKIDLIINIPSGRKKEISDGYLIRRGACDLNIPLITNLQLAELLVESIYKKKLDDLEIEEWQEY